MQIDNKMSVLPCAVLPCAVLTMCENWNSEILKNIAQITNKAHKY